MLDIHALGGRDEYRREIKGELLDGLHRDRLGRFRRACR
jgi:hypothetical protein